MKTAGSADRSSFEKIVQEACPNQHHRGREITSFTQMGGLRRLRFIRLPVSVCETGMTYCGLSGSSTYVAPLPSMYM
jgi:hypothetical protein